MGSSYRGLRRVASFRPYTPKQVGDTGPAESARRRNLRALGSSFSGARGTQVLILHIKKKLLNRKTGVNMLNLLIIIISQKKKIIGNRCNCSQAVKIYTSTKSNIVHTACTIYIIHILIHPLFSGSVRNEE